MDVELVIVMSFWFLAVEVIVIGIAALIAEVRKTKYRKTYRLGFLISMIEGVIYFFLITYMDETGMFDYGKTLPAIYGVLALVFAAIPTLVAFFNKQYRKEYLPSTAEIRENERRQLDEKILKTRYMSGDTVVTSKLSTSSAVGRAVVGNAIAGDVGAIVGASTAKQKTKEKHTTTFLVFYKDGHKNLETVEDGTLRFEVYVDKLEIE